MIERSTQVPFAALERQHGPLTDELRSAYERVVAASSFILGAEVDAFEREFAAYLGCSHVVGVASGTAALTIALRAAGVRAGDEVVVPALTFIASALAVRLAGATPVFCDVHEGTGLLDADSAASVVSHRTVALLPVHLYGQVCDMTAIQALADRCGLMVIEDAAQAHGATRGTTPAGAFGTAAAFSFYPSKNLGCLGDGGAIATDDAAIAAAARRLRDLGQREKGVHVELGGNERLDGLQAAFLRAKLPHLDTWNAARRAVAEEYRAHLPSDVGLLEEDRAGDPAYHLFPIRVGDRDELADRLSAEGVQTGIHYTPALPDQPPFTDLPPVVATPRAEAWAREELSLPMFAEMTRAEARYVADTVSALTRDGCGVS